jgi:hypothetical protein
VGCTAHWDEEGKNAFVILVAPHSTSDSRGDDINAILNSTSVLSSDLVCVFVVSWSKPLTFTKTSQHVFVGI